MALPPPADLSRPPAGGSDPSARDAEKQAALRRARIVATSLLVFSITLMIVAKLLEHRHPVFGFVAAFAEADLRDLALLTAAPARSASARSGPGRSARE